MANAVLVGKMNVRQLRIGDQSCRPFSSNRHHSDCVLTYDAISRENMTLGRYYTAEQTGAAVYSGQFSLYGGDGFLWSFPVGYERYDLAGRISSHPSRSK